MAGKKKSDESKAKRERKLPRNINLIFRLFILAGALFHIYSITYLFPETIWYHTFHVTFFLILSFGLYTSKLDKSGDKISPDDIINIVLSITVFIYMTFNYMRYIFRMKYLDPVPLMDVIIGVILIYLILRALYRLVGIPLVVLSAVILLYARFGYIVPGKFHIQGFSVARIVEQLYMTTDGIFGLSVMISSNYVFAFILFGSFLKIAGGGDFIFDFSKALVGSARGGIAKISVITSGLFGSISGSPIANVCVTGAFTIPNMKKAGYSSRFAAATEAIASTGGCIAPPVMGAVAFLMAEVLGVAYLDIIVIAIIPAFLYYFALFMTVDFRADKLGLKGLPREELPKINWKMMKEGTTFFVPMIVLIWLLVKGWSPVIAAFGSILSILILGILRGKNRLGFKDIVEALESGTKSTINVAVIMAATGIVIGLLNQTGLGIKLGSLIFSMGNNNFLLGITFSMLICLVLGMGMNISPAYLITVTIAGPALLKIGTDPMAAHLFVVYFAALAGVTPPVAVTTFTAAGIAGSDPMKSGITGFRLGIAGFIVPYLFVFNPALLLKGSVSEIIIALLLACIGLVAIIAAGEGWLRNKINRVERIILGIAGILILPFPIGIYLKIVGFILLVISYYINKRNESKQSIAV